MVVDFGIEKFLIKLFLLLHNFYVKKRELHTSKLREKLIIRLYTFINMNSY